MKKIVIEPGSWGARLLEHLAKRKKELEAKIEERIKFLREKGKIE